MKKLTIVVGTTSTQKISYLKEVLKEFQIKAVIKPIEVKSEISGQPTTSKETKTGSINRAQNALKEVNNADFSLGIEVGYHKYLKNKYEMFCWATIFDKQGHKISKQSHRFLLPEYHQKILSSGKYLGDNLDSYSRRKKDAIIAHIDNTIRYRKPFIISALEKVIIHFFRKEEL